MEDYVLAKKSKETEDFSRDLGFSKTHFLNENFAIIKSQSKGEILHLIQEAKKKRLKTFYQPETEDLLRFVLEKTAIDVVFSLEKIHPKDSTHFVRGGLDQVLCTLAAEKGKMVAFSFADLLHSSDRGKLLGRMMFNAALCRKYKVPVAICSFAPSLLEMRSAKDFQALGRILRL